MSAGDTPPSNAEEIIWTGSALGALDALHWGFLSEPDSKLIELEFSISDTSTEEPPSLDLPSRSMDDDEPDLQVRITPHQRPSVAYRTGETSGETWRIAITAGFRAAITQLDKKLLGRVLEAISVLSDEPMKLRGDTIKPLQDSRRGDWRYRIGDWRLIYRPIKPELLIMLLDFNSRGEVYR